MILLQSPLCTSLPYKTTHYSSSPELSESYSNRYNNKANLLFYHVFTPTAYVVLNSSDFQALYRQQLISQKIYRKKGEIY